MNRSILGTFRASTTSTHSTPTGVCMSARRERGKGKAMLRWAMKPLRECASSDWIALLSVCWLLERLPAAAS